jgi:hypothetical protein
MTTEALAQGFTRMLTDAVFADQVKRNPAAALGYLDLEEHESQLLANAAAEGVDSMGEEHGGAMKAVAVEMGRNQAEISEPTQAALSQAVQQKMMEQLARADIADKAFDPDEQEH